MHHLLAATPVSFPVLTTIVVVPVLGALALLLLPSNRPGHFKQVAFLVSVLVAGMTAWVMLEFDAGRAAGMRTVTAEWGYLGTTRPEAWQADDRCATPAELLDLMHPLSTQG